MKQTLKNVTLFFLSCLALFITALTFNEYIYFPYVQSKLYSLVQKGNIPDLKSYLNTISQPEKYINHFNSSYNQPLLHTAILKHDEELVWTLIQFGADLNLKNSKGKDAVSFCYDNKPVYRNEIYQLSKEVDQDEYVRSKIKYMKESSKIYNLLTLANRREDYLSEHKNSISLPKQDDSEYSKILNIIFSEIMKHRDEFPQLQGYSGSFFCEHYSFFMSKKVYKTTKPMRGRPSTLTDIANDGFMLSMRFGDYIDSPLAGIDGRTHVYFKIRLINGQSFEYTLRCKNETLFTLIRNIIYKNAKHLYE